MRSTFNRGVSRCRAIFTARGRLDWHSCGTRQSLLDGGAAVLRKWIVNRVLTSRIGMTLHCRGNHPRSELIDHRAQEVDCGYMLFLQVGIPDRKIVETEPRWV